MDMLASLIGGSSGIGLLSDVLGGAGAASPLAALFGNSSSQSPSDGIGQASNIASTIMNVASLAALFA